MRPPKELENARIIQESVSVVIAIGLFLSLVVWGLSHGCAHEAQVAPTVQATSETPEGNQQDDDGDEVGREGNLVLKRYKVGDDVVCYTVSNVRSDDPPSINCIKMWQSLPSDEEEVP